MTYLMDVLRKEIPDSYLAIITSSSDRWSIADTIQECGLSGLLDGRASPDALMRHAIYAAFAALFKDKVAQTRTPRSLTLFGFLVTNTAQSWKTQTALLQWLTTIYTHISHCRYPSNVWKLIRVHRNLGPRELLLFMLTAGPPRLGGSTSSMYVINYDRRLAYSLSISWSESDIIMTSCESNQNRKSSEILWQKGSVSMRHVH